MTDERDTRSDAPTGGERVYGALVDAGVDLLVGLPGTQTLPLDRVVAARDEMRYLMVRHETAVPHVAWGYYEAGGGVAATLTVPGPGDTNAAHGLKNATEDSVPLIHVSPHASPEEFGNGPIHELDARTFDHVVKANCNVERPRDLPETVARGIETALSPPFGAVRLGVPSAYMTRRIDAPDVAVEPERVGVDNTGAIERAAETLGNADRPVVIAGGGVRRSEGGVAALETVADRLDAPVAVTYKGKGSLPEASPRFLAACGSHTPAGARQVLDRADAVLVLGSDLDGVTTDHWDLPLGDDVIHATLEPDHLDRGYEADATVVADVTAAVDGLLERLPDDTGGWDGREIAAAVQDEYHAVLRDRGLIGVDRWESEDGEAAVPTPAALRSVRRALPEETVVTVDIGGFRLWGTQVFETCGPERFVQAGSWAGMGVGLPAALGAGIARPDRPIACLIGDGGFMMCLQELHTAVEEDLPMVVVVFDNADYGIISKSADIEGVDASAFAWESPDFATIAEGFGCRGVTVRNADALETAVTEGLGTAVPTVVDVRTPTGEPSVVEAAEYESTIDLS